MPARVWVGCCLLFLRRTRFLSPHCLVYPFTIANLYHSGTLSFFYDHARHCIRLECVALYDRCYNDSDDKPAQCRAPIAAYVNRGLIQEARRRSLYPESHLLGDRVTMGVFRRKLKAITPPDDRFDPYIFAILIATAQGQQKASLEVPSGDSTFTVRNSFELVCSDALLTRPLALLYPAPRTEFVERPGVHVPV